ncbi:hypothetical protein AMAG_09933 [Allomyces macrogynus ATCC 38327]|uniref:ATP-grasp domain-containing protein n=1 Tax=Allomyces macrogynus (strain ATCC 38327) TaxID=578462 RepID=A0A0L0SQC5_ALLM3|nr:hypothetical protein AMAG_09933 [Allomyces macrogynus ATCC 38327]|eukprot:KNE64574.1 hypothetical protein AMAG_09933 [Allomyces macrogynus ATCC 38327]
MPAHDLIGATAATATTSDAHLADAAAALTLDGPSPARSAAAAPVPVKTAPRAPATTTSTPLIASPIAGHDVHLIYDPSYANPALHTDLIVPVRELGCKSVTTWVVTDENAEELARQVPKDGVLVLHADMPPGLTKGAEFTALRMLLRAGQFPHVLGHVPAFCERTLHKSRMHDQFVRAQIPHADSLIVPTLDALNGPATRDFVDRILANAPGTRLFIKVDNGFNSCGLTSGCVVDSYDALVAAASPLVEAHGAIVVQRYLAGREFTVAVCDTPVGVRAFHAVERVFLPGQLFSPPDGTAAEKVVQGEPELVEACRAAARDAYVAVGGCAWGRVDVRCDDAGRVYVLEVNNTASFAPDSYFAMSTRAEGVDRAQVLAWVAQAAWDRPVGWMGIEEEGEEGVSED